jgi:hypothetical protein
LPPPSVKMVDEVLGLWRVGMVMPDQDVGWYSDVDWVAAAWCKSTDLFSFIPPFDISTIWIVPAKSLQSIA